MSDSEKQEDRRAESAKAVTGLIALILAKLPANGVNFLVAIVLARLVAPTEQGTFALALFCVVMGSTLLDFGVNEALLFGRVEPDAVASHAAIRVSISSLLVLIAVIADLVLPEAFALRGLLPAVAIAQAAALIYATPKIILEYEQRVPVLAALELAGVCVGALAGLIIAQAHGGAWALAGQLVASNGTVAIAGLVAARSRYSLRATRSLVLKTMREFGVPLWWASSIALLLVLDVPIAAAVGGKAGVGEYSKALTLVMTFGPLASGAMVRLVVPLFVRRRNDRPALAALFVTVLSAKVGFLLPGYLLVAVLAPFWFVAALGEEWAAALVPFQFLTIYVAARLFIDDQLLIPSVVAGRPRVALVMQVSWAGTAAALMAACGLAFGVPGVAAGLALGSVAAAVGITAWSSHFLHVSLKRPAATAFGYLSGFAIAAVAVPVLQPWGPFVSSGALLAAAAAMVWVIGRPVATGRQALDAIANSQHV